jgi:hypothetical protein
MPIAIALGALVLAGIGVLLLSGGSASAGTSSGTGTGTGSRTGGTTGGTTGGLSRAKDEAKKVVGGIFLNIPGQDVRPVPTPGAFYRIKEGDTGSGIAAKAYGPTTPTKQWYKVAAHPANKSKLGTDWARWFLPKWSDNGTEWLGTFSGEYALIYVPKVGEL